MTTRTLIIILLCSLLLPITGLGQPDAEGQLFLNAKNAAQKGNWPQFETLKAQLANYPLLPYLEYYQLDRNFNTVSDAATQQFLDKYPNTPLAYRLRVKWLTKLAHMQQWLHYIAIYQPTTSVVLQCNYLYALQQTGKAQEADLLIPTLWQTGQSQPGDCDVVFTSWLNTKADKDILLWQRFELALKIYNFGLANYLSKQMSDQKKNEALAIIKLYSQPNLVNNTVFQKKYPSAEVISFGIARMAQRDPSNAIQTWNRLKSNYVFTQVQKQRIFQAIALKFALRKNNQSLIWFQKVINDKLDSVYQDWLIRAGIYHQDWKLVKKRIEIMPKKERDLSQWQYWYARALDELGDKKSAAKIFAAVAKDHCYYGFLAESYTKRSIELTNITPVITTAEVVAVKQLPGFQRATLLYQLNLQYDAALELNNLINEVDQHQRYIITKLVSDWQWYPETLLLSNKLIYKVDFSLRFPLLYENTVNQNANLRALNPALIYAIIRQESYFGANSFSPAGAIGLMQMMPTTALRTSKQFQIKYSDTKELLNPEVNIAFGSAHLKKSLGDFANNPVLAIAAYNAGPEAVNRWLPKGKIIPADIWIETIPFHETRNYIKNVISNFIVYQYRLGQVPNLESIMPVVKTTLIKQVTQKIK